MAEVPCGGDGGSPYAAPASPRGRACDVCGAPGWLGLVVVALPTISLLLLAALGLVLKRRRLLVGGLTAFVVGILLLFVPLALPKRCPGDDQTAPGCEHY